MLRRLKLHNYRTYLNADLTFQRRHLLIGHNNSGKTNLASAIRFLAAASTSDLATAATCVPGGILEMRNWHLASDTIEMSCICDLDIEGETCEFTYRLILQSMDTSYGAQPELRVVQEQLLLNAPGFTDVMLVCSDGDEARLLHEDNHLKGVDPRVVKTRAPSNETMLSKLYEPEANRRAILFRSFVSGWSYYLLNPEAMRSGWRTPTPPFAVLDVRGEYLANALFQLKNLDEMRYRRVIEHTRLVEPAIEAINFIAPAPDQGAMPFVALQGRPAASWAGLSDGTLRFLAIAYLTEVSNFWAGTAHQIPRLTIIEEPENGIYPGQLRAMFDLFDERAPQGQFIFTSHSPYFIDLFDATRDAVTILKRNKDRTEIVSAPPVAPEEQSPERLTLAEKYAAELIG